LVTITFVEQGLERLPFSFVFGKSEERRKGLSRRKRGMNNSRKGGKRKRPSRRSMATEEKRKENTKRAINSMLGGEKRGESLSLSKKRKEERTGERAKKKGKKAPERQYDNSAIRSKRQKGWQIQGNNLVDGGQKRQGSTSIKEGKKLKKEKRRIAKRILRPFKKGLKSTKSEDGAIKMGTGESKKKKPLLDFGKGRQRHQKGLAPLWGGDDDVWKNMARKEGIVLELAIGGKIPESPVQARKKKKGPITQCAKKVKKNKLFSEKRGPGNWQPHFKEKKASWEKKGATHQPR